MSDLSQQLISLRREIIKKDFSKMNAEQFSAVVTVNGPLLILAGAGSGKTTVLINRIVYMIKYGNAFQSDILPPDITESDLDLLNDVLSNPERPLDFRAKQLLSVNPVSPYSVMAITFTNKAAEELKNRLETSLSADAYGVTASTFHSFCVRVLRRYADVLGYKSSFLIYDTDDSRRLMKQCQKELDIDDKVLPHRTVLNAISRAKDGLISSNDYAELAKDDYRRKLIASLYTLYQKRLREANAMDFDDIIFNTVLLLENSPEALDFCSERYKYIMVDEYQDTSHAQYVFIKLLADRYKNICVVGDDNQSIYRFRGATIENILSFEKQYKNTVTVRLEQNYRSTGNILNAANNIIKNNKNRKEKNLWTELGSGEKVTVYTASDEYDEAKFIADGIVSSVQKGNSFSQSAVLYRMNAQSGVIETVFSRSGIPYKVIGGTKFYSRKEIKDILAYMQVVANPADSLHLRRIINEPKRGIGEATVAKIFEISDSLGIPPFEVIAEAESYQPLSRSAAKLGEFNKIMQYLFDFAQNHSVSELVTEIYHKSGYENYLKLLGIDGEDRIENVKELHSTVVRFEQEDSDELPTLEAFLEGISLITDIDEYNESNDSVVMMTMHAAKGLEFDNVYIVGMEEGVFPGNQSIMGGESEIEEERRLAYVGVTRAKKHLTLSNAVTRVIFGQTMRNTPSRFLSEIPPGYTDCIGRSVFPSFSIGGEHSAEEDFSPSRHTFSGKTEKSPKPSFGFKPAKKPLPGYSVSQRVRHNGFGDGTILEIKTLSSDSLITVRFDKIGKKILMAKYANLEIIQ